MIHVYTGDGKGKTTASLGLALRCLGWGKRVCLIQFLKKGDGYGELRSLRAFPGCECVQFGRGELLTPDNVSPFDSREAARGLEHARMVVREKRADLLILDEINFVLHIGLIGIEEVKDLIRNCPAEIEIVLTGRHCPGEIKDLADYVSDMREIKHPYRQGKEGRKGIEF
jgi:cob(I)alamin adenosyltransferase